MGEYFLQGAEYKVTDYREKEIEELLNTLVGRNITCTLKTNEITILVEFNTVIDSFKRRENRVESGHLTIDDIYYDLVNHDNIKFYLPMNQFLGVERYPNLYILYFHRYHWRIRF